MHKKLYYHKTDGGAEYLTDQCIENPDGSLEGVFKDAKIIVRIDGNIREDAKISIADDILESTETEQKQTRLLSRALQAAINCRINWFGETVDKHGITYSFGVANSGRKHNEEYVDLLFVRTTGTNGTADCTIVDYLSAVHARNSQNPANGFAILTQPFVEIALQKRGAQ